MKTTPNYSRSKDKDIWNLNVNYELPYISKQDVFVKHSCPRLATYLKQQNVSMKHGCPVWQMDGCTNRQTYILTNWNNNMFLVICVMFHNDWTLTWLNLLNQNLNWAEWMNWRWTNGWTVGCNSNWTYIFKEWYVDDTVCEVSLKSDINFTKSCFDQNP